MTSVVVGSGKTSCQVNHLFSTVIVFVFISGIGGVFLLLGGTKMQNAKPAVSFRGWSIRSIVD